MPNPNYVLSDISTSLNRLVEHTSKSVQLQERAMEQQEYFRKNELAAFRRQEEEFNSTLTTLMQQVATMNAKIFQQQNYIAELERIIRSQDSAVGTEKSGSGETETP